MEKLILDAGFAIRDEDARFEFRGFAIQE